MCLFTIIGQKAPGFNRGDEWPLAFQFLMYHDTTLRLGPQSLGIQPVEAPAFRPGEWSHSRRYGPHYFLLHAQIHILLGTFNASFKLFLLHLEAFSGHNIVFHLFRRFP
ncbi:MAG: hypothetical protein DDT19_00663 [Syntrophomonadaceae bacterium]|nr:hypothetical protein [Bacillota bacterium]